MLFSLLNYVQRKGWVKHFVQYCFDSIWSISDDCSADLKLMKESNFNLSILCWHNNLSRFKLKKTCLRLLHKLLKVNCHTRKKCWWLLTFQFQVSDRDICHTLKTSLKAQVLNLQFANRIRSFGLRVTASPNAHTYSSTHKLLHFYT